MPCEPWAGTTAITVYRYSHETGGWRRFYLPVCRVHFLSSESVVRVMERDFAPGFCEFLCEGVLVLSKALDNAPCALPRLTVAEVRNNLRGPGVGRHVFARAL